MGEQSVRRMVQEWDERSAERSVGMKGGRRALRWDEMLVLALGERLVLKKDGRSARKWDWMLARMLASM